MYRQDFEKKKKNIENNKAKGKFFSSKNIYISWTGKGRNKLQKAKVFEIHLLFSSKTNFYLFKFFYIYQLLSDQKFALK